MILTNVEVLTAGTKIERETDKDKPIAVTVVTLLVDPDRAERLTLASTEGKIRLALQPARQGDCDTRGIKRRRSSRALSATPRATARDASVSAAA